MDMHIERPYVRRILSRAIGVLVVIVTVSAVVFGNTRSSQKRRASDQTWSTYTNAEFGYSLQHPTDMIVREWTPGDDILANVTFYPRADQNPLGGAAGLSVLVFCNASGLSASDWVGSRQELAPIDGSSETAAESTSTTPLTATVLLDGLPAVSFRADLEQSVEHVVVARDSTIIDIASADLGNDDVRNLFEQMRATVKLHEAAWARVGTIGNCGDR